MGKGNDAGGLKALAKRSKMVGLQKLRFYCQMCQRQCRDENGMKQHMATEGHLRQMKLFSENAGGIIDDFSKDFRDGYLHILSQRHGRVKIDANKVYQEYIQDKHHVHMNSTKWTTLSEFVTMLGRESFCTVEETDRGWMIEYIDRDPKAMARAEEEKKRKRVEVDDEERRKKQIAAQVKAAGSTESDRVGEELVRTGDSEKISLSMGVVGPGNNAPRLKKPRLVPNAFGNEEEEVAPAAAAPSSSSSSSGGAAALMQEEERRKGQQVQANYSKSHQENWLHPGIQVKIKNKGLADGRFYNQKGAVLAVVDKFAGDVLVEGVTVRLDQNDLETVLPKAGREVLIVNGRCRGCKARLLEVKVEQYTCVLSVLEGPCSGTELKDVEYEDICKLST